MNDEEGETFLGLGILGLLGGAGAGILFLLLWYLVFGAAGLTSASQLGITIPFTSYTLHHEIIGIAIIGSGAPFLISGNRYLFTAGIVLIGLGGALFTEDLIQHCAIPNISNGGIGIGACTAWP